MNTIQMTVGERKIAAAHSSEADAFWRRFLEGAAAFGIRRDIAGPSGQLPPQRLASIPVETALDSNLWRGSGQEENAFLLLLAAATAALIRATEGEEDGILAVGRKTAKGTTEFLPFRVSLSEQDSLRSLLAKTVDNARLAFRFSNYPHDLIAPVLQIGVVLGLGEPVFDPAPFLDLCFFYVSARRGARIDVFGIPDKFRADTAALLGQRLVVLLREMSSHPSKRIAEIDLLLDSDRAMLAEVNSTGTDIPVTSLPHLFDRVMSMHSARRAVIIQNASYTFAELDIASRRIAAAVLTADLGPNPIVGVFAQRSFDMLVAIIGVLRAGGAYVPMDPSQPAARIAYFLSDSRAGAVLCTPEHSALLPETILKIDLAGGGANPLPSEALPEVSPHSAAYVIYTSGSTGVPKGVVVEHHSVVNRLKWMQAAYPITHEDVLIQKTPLTFDVSVWELFWWLIEGASVVLPPPSAEKEPQIVTELVQAHHVTIMHFVPTMLGAFLEYTDQTRSASQVESLRCVFTSGEALQAHQAQTLFRLLPNVQLVNLYGPTEATVDVTHHAVSPDDTIVPIGKPIFNMRLYILDSHMSLCGVGMVGELHLAGRGLARGYLNKAELTAERFISGESLGETRLYRTGDLARWLPDGVVEYLGRNDFQVKLRGFRIELGEIEHRLCECPGVSNAVAIVRESDHGFQHLYAYIVGSFNWNEAELKGRLATNLPDYMIPERIIQLDSFPLSPSGKLDRKALPDPSACRSDYVAPRNETEAQLAAIWSNVLGVEKIGVTESFFTLGGNSIHFVSVLAQARKLGLNFTFQQLFQNPTMEGLVRNGGVVADGDEMPGTFAPFSLISQQDRAKIPAEIEDAYPMSMLQIGLIYQSEIMRGNTSYHDLVSYLIQGEMDIHLFRRAVEILVAENPIFRTSYQLTNDHTYLQFVHREVEELPLIVEDLRGRVPESDQEAYYADWFHKEQSRPFEWSRPGLIRLHIHIIADDLFRYSISQHNSMLDGWSMNQVHTKLFEIYYSLRATGTYEYQAVDNHLRNFIGLEQQALASETFRQFWADHLRDRPRSDVPRLRAQHPAEEIQVAFRDIELPRGLSERIIGLAHSLAVPVKTVLLAAHMKVLSTITGQTDVFTGYEHSGRPELPGADRALGVFLNTMPFRMKLVSGSWRALIQQTYQREASVLPYRRYPMAKVKQDLRTTDLLFETVFNFTHFYSLKELKKLPEFALLDVRAAAITEFPLRVEVSQHFYTDEVQLSLHYHTASFDEDHIERIGGYFVQSLQRMVDATDAAHDADALLSRSEHDLLEQFSANHPDHPVLVDNAQNRVPIGTCGTIASDGRRACWSADGVLHLDEGAPQLPCVGGIIQPSMEDPADRTKYELLVAQVWSDVLDLPVDSLQRQADFFEIGGNSLKALKVVLKMNGVVTLRDFMQASRLGELALVIERSKKQQEQEPMLVPLVTPAEGRHVSIICLPYAGGNAAHFRPFAQSLRQRCPKVDIYGIELPGHNYPCDEGPLCSLRTIIGRIVEEVSKKIEGPVYLWGHCVGSALALATAKYLQDVTSVEIAGVFLAAKLLHAPEEIENTIGNARNLRFDDIRDLYANWSGEDGLNELGPAFQEFLVRIFRHDSIETNAYLLAEQRASGGKPLTIPTTLVVASDDPLTENYATSYREWEKLVATVKLHVIDGGGHYFMRTRADDVAAYVSEVLE